MTRRAHRVGARLAVAVVGLAAAALLPVPAAPAAPPDPDVPALVVDALEPAVAARDDAVLRASGRVRAGAESLEDATVRLRVSTTPVRTRGELAAVAAGDQTPSDLERDVSEPFDVEPGAEGTWDVGVPLGRVGLSAAGVYPVRLELRDGDGVTTLTSLTTFLTWFPSGTVVEPTLITWVVTLAGEPVRDADGVFLDDRLAADLAPGGRLRALLDGLDDKPVDWVVDPELLEAAAQMAGGYRVRRDDGTVVAGGASASEAARRFVEDARAVLSPEDWAMAYADPDADALVGADLDQELTDAVSTGAEVARAVLQGKELGDELAVPADGHADRQALAALRAAGVRAVVLADTALPVTSPLTYTPDGRARVQAGGRLDALLADSTLTGIVSSPEDAGGDELARQRFLAETLVITQERPSDSRSLVVAPPRDWDVSSELAATVVSLSEGGLAPWLGVQGVRELRAQPEPDVERAGLTRPDDLPRLPNRLVDGVQEVSERFSTFSGVLEEDSGTVETYRTALLRTVSSAWRTDRQSGLALLDAVRRELESDMDKVRLLSRGTVTLSGTEGRIPVTVANDLDQPVVVDVRLTSRAPGRLAVTQPGEVRVEKGRRLSLEIEARAASGGTVPVEVQLYTRTGAAYGDVVTISVRSTAYSRLGLAVVGAALGALVILVVTRLVRRMRSRGAAA